MTLKIYGVPQSRAMRAFWMAEELGIPYERVEHGFGAEKKPELLAVNANGRIPAIDDDGLHLFESMAINLYLAKKHDKGLAPKNLAEEAQATQWSFWVMTEAEKPLLNALFATLGLMGNAKDPDKVQQAVGELQKPFGVLNAHLQGKQYILGDRFTVADLNVASVLSFAQGARIDLSGFPNLADWLSRCLSRPAAKKGRT